MSKWIDAEWLLNFVAEFPDHYTLTVGNLRAVVNDAPSIDIEPKRGEWVKRTHNTLIAQVNFAYCSECGQPIMHEHTRSLWNFCPNCGAKMKGADDE